MRDDQRQCVRVPGSNVNEVNVEAVDLGDELRDGVEPRFDLAPIIVGLPVARELAHGRELHALGVVGDGFLFWPPGRGQAPAKVDQCCFGHMDAERADLAFGRAGCARHRHEVCRTRCDDAHRGATQELAAVLVDDF